MDGLDRRQFLKASAAALALAAIAPNKIAAQTGRKVRFGISDDMLFRPWGGEEGPGVVPARGLKVFKDSGIDCMRLWTYWNNIQPNPGFPIASDGLKHLDLQVQLAYVAGIDVSLNIMWAPPWSTQGKPTLVPWNCMNVKSIPDFDYTKPECTSPPPFPTDDWVNFTKFIASRYDGVVKVMHPWNEPQYPIFWPYRTTNGFPDNEYLVDAVLAPFYKAVKSVSNILVASHEQTNPEFLRDVLMMEQAKGRLADINSLHEYCDPSEIDGKMYRYPDAGFYKLDHWYKGVLEQYGEGRPVWITETAINAWDEPGETTFKDLETAINATSDPAKKAELRKELSSLRAPKRLQMTDEFVGGFLRRQNDPGALQVDRVYLHQVRSHPSIDPDCMQKDPDTSSLLYCDNTPTPVLDRMKEILHPYKRRAVR